MASIGTGANEDGCISRAKSVGEASSSRTRMLAPHQCLQRDCGWPEGSASGVCSSRAVSAGGSCEEKSEEGQFEEPFDEFKWSMEIKRVELPAPVTGQKGSIQDVVGQQLTKEISNTVRELRLVVSWTELGEEQSIDVVTHIVKM